jgi:hypothetical protein
VLVTSKELKYMMVQSWDVGVSKRVMPQAITFWEKYIESFHPFYRHPKYCEYAQSLLFSVRGTEGFNSWAGWAEYVHSLQSSEEIRNFWELLQQSL